MDRQGFVNESARHRGAIIASAYPFLPLHPVQAVPAGRRSSAAEPSSRQPPLIRQHRASKMPFYRPLLSLLVLVLPASLMAQGTPMIPASSASGASAAASTVSATVRPALSQVAQTLDGINVKRWKAPNPVRDGVEGDISSIQRDLSGTLAGLLQQADAAPTSVPAAFSVYRNVDALYDTLLRVVETAELAAPENEEAQLETSLKTLENARSSLGDAILSGSEREQAEVIQLRTAAAAVVENHREQVKTTVVDDGPASAHTVHHKHTTTAAKKPEPKTTQSTQNPSSPQ